MLTWVPGEDAGRGRGFGEEQPNFTSLPNFMSLAKTGFPPAIYTKVLMTIHLKAGLFISSRRPQISNEFNYAHGPISQSVPAPIRLGGLGRMLEGGVGAGMISQISRVCQISPAFGGRSQI